MGSLFESTKNTRFLLSDCAKYIRSDLPINLSEKEIQWLLQNNVRTIIDLRSATELEQKPCALANNSHFRYINMPVTGGNIVPNAPSQVACSYLNMVDDAMWKIIELIESSETNVMYFCNAGKDRTAVVSALLLLRMEVEKTTIIEDYLKSANNLREMLQAYAIQNPTIDINVITPHASYMEEFLSKLTK